MSDRPSGWSWFQCPAGMAVMAAHCGSDAAYLWAYMHSKCNVRADPLCWSSWAEYRDATGGWGNTRLNNALHELVRVHAIRAHRKPPRRPVVYWVYDSFWSLPGDPAANWWPEDRIHRSRGARP